MTREIQSVVQKFRLGDAWVTTILDGAQWRTPLNPPFAMDKSEAELQAIGQANRLPWTGFQNSFTPTLIQTGKDLVLFDVGFGAAGRDSGCGQLRHRLTDAGYHPDDVTIVALTHVHPDHILGLWEGDELAFPNARHMIGRVEFDAWMSGEKIPPQRQANRQMFLDHVAPLAEQMTFLEDGDQVAAGLSAEAAFGHSAGHMMFRFTQQAQQLLIWGDLTNHYVYSLKYPDSPVGFDDDKAQAASSRNRVLDMAATDDLLVSGHHMPFPSIGYVERDGDGYRWVPASYQIWQPDDQPS